MSLVNLILISIFFIVFVCVCVCVCVFFAFFVFLYIFMENRQQTLNFKFCTKSLKIWTKIAISTKRGENKKGNE